MEVSEMLEMLVGELTAYQFISLLFAFVMMIALLFMSVAAVAEIVAHIIKGLVYIFRKDKYKSRDLTVKRAYSHLAFLRNQAKKADSEQAYLLLFNRLVAAYEAYVEIGVFSYDDMKKHIKIFGFRSRYHNRVYGEYYKKYDEKAAKEKKEREADERVLQADSQEKCPEINPNK